MQANGSLEGNWLLAQSAFCPSCKADPEEEACRQVEFWKLRFWWPLYSGHFDIQYIRESAMVGAHGRVERLRSYYEVLFCIQICYHSFSTSGLSGICKLTVTLPYHPSSTSIRFVARFITGLSCSFW